MNISHHANLMYSEYVTDWRSVLDTTNYEVAEQVFEKFGINEAREVIKKANLMPSNASLQLIVVTMQSITLEAQNSLLKILEDPPPTSNFLFIIPESCSLISTLHSRFNKLEIHQEQKVDEEIFTTFINASLADQLAEIDKETKAKNDPWLHSIKAGIIRYMKSYGPEIPNYADYEMIARLLLVRGSSNKMLLEHFVLLNNTSLKD